MAMSCMIRKASSHIPFTVRAVASSSYPGLLFRKAIEHKKTFSTVVDDPNSSEIKILEKQLYKILRSQLKINEPCPLVMPPSAPANFPFTFEMNPAYNYYFGGIYNFTLKREIGSENIDIKVSYDEKACVMGNEKCWELEVKVSKENGSALEFGVRAFEKTRYEIDTVYVNEVGSEYIRENLLFVYEKEMLDVNEAFRKYLDIRGMKEIDFGFLNKCVEYIHHKQSLRDHELLLSKVKQFVKGSKDHLESESESEEDDQSS